MLKVRNFRSLVEGLMARVWESSAAAQRRRRMVTSRSGVLDAAPSELVETTSRALLPQHEEM